MAKTSPAQLGGTIAEIRSALAAVLPIRIAVNSITVMTEQPDHTWTVLTEIELGAATSPP